MQSIKAIKDSYRKTSLDFRKKLNREEKFKKDETIYKKFIALSIKSEFKTLLCYVSAEIEVDTFGIIDYCFENNIKVAVPRCIDDGIMKFFYISSVDDLEKGKYGIYEPKSYCSEYLPDDKSLCIVPALSADLNGYRIGYGKGYYDRFLSDYKGKSVVLGYKENLKSELPIGEFDRKCDLIITD